MKSWFVVISLIFVAALVETLACTLTEGARLDYKNKIGEDTKTEKTEKFSNLRQQQQEQQQQHLCLTPSCVKQAATILKNMDESIEPCHDFYRFACGGWKKKNSIPEHKPYYSTYYQTADNLDLQLRRLLEEELDGTEPPFITITKRMYDTCIDAMAIENASTRPLQNVLKSVGGWPVVKRSKWNEWEFDWIETALSLRKLGCNFDTLLHIYVDVDDKSNYRNIIKLDQPSLGMPDRSYFSDGLNDTYADAYYRKMVEAAVALGANETEAESELLEALKFEMALANYSVSWEERRNVTRNYNKFTIKELQSMAPQIPWLKYINGLAVDEIFENETVIVIVPEFVKKVAELVTSVDKRVIANYMIWRVVDDSLPLLSRDWREIEYEYYKVLTGTCRPKPRWETCLWRLKKVLGIALSSYYVRHYFTDETKNEVSKMTKYIHKEFLRTLEEVDWMDEKTKAHAKEKANNMLFYVGYPEELLNDNVMMEHYQTLTISNESYYENYLRIQKWISDCEFSKLRKQNIRRDWKKYAKVAEVNGYYYRSKNAILIPAGYLQSPLFSNDRPNYLNFATTGAAIGHEIAHGFDDRGRKYGKDGNLINWWGKSAEEYFLKEAQCIIEQYNNYTIGNSIKLNGVGTQSENIADNVGYKEAYRAYQSWVKDNGPEPLLPGLKYNQNQLFWIGIAYKWCANYRQNCRSILLDPHSPAEFRVTGSLSNIPEFAEDFNCPLGSPMNRKQKCIVW